MLTTETDRIRIAEIVKREVAPYIENGRRPLTESSRLLRNVRKRFQRNKQVLIAFAIIIKKTILLVSAAGTNVANRA